MYHIPSRAKGLGVSLRANSSRRHGADSRSKFRATAGPCDEAPSLYNSVHLLGALDSPPIDNLRERNADWKTMPRRIPA